MDRASLYLSVVQLSFQLFFFCCSNVPWAPRNGQSFTLHRTFLLSLFQCFINNKFVDAVSGKTFPTVDPRNEQTIIEVAEGDKVCF